jgi:hypothetical protein
MVFERKTPLEEAKSRDLTSVLNWLLGLTAR